MSNEEKKLVAYIVACVGEFARASDLTTQDAFRYLETNGGIDFLLDCYDTEHLLSFEDAIEDLMIITGKSSGMIV